MKPDTDVMTSVLRILHTYEFTTKNSIRLLTVRNSEVDGALTTLNVELFNLGS